MSSPNGIGTFEPNENTSEVNNEVPGSSVQNGRNNRSIRSASVRWRRAIRRAMRNSRRQHVRNGDTSNTTTDDDDDLHFFMSLSPYLQGIPRILKLRIRDKVQRVIMKQLDKYNNPNNGGSSNNINNRIPIQSPPSFHPITSQEGLPQVQNPIQHPLPVYPFIPHFHHVHGNVNNFLTPLPPNSEYSLLGQQVIPSHAEQQIYQPAPHFSGQQPLSAFAGQQQQQQHNMPYYSEQQPTQPYDYLNA